MTNTADQQLALVAQAQAGCFTYDQALSAGLSPSAVQQRLTRGSWVSLHRHVYCAATSKRTRELTAVAALLRAGASAAFSHLTGARLLGHDLRHESPYVWLTTPMPSPVRSFGLVRIVRTRHPVEPLLAHGYPTIPDARTIVDLAGLLDASALTGLLYDAVRRRKVTVGAVLAEAERIGGGRSGLRLLRRVTRQFDPAFEMMVEARVGQALSAVGVHMTPQFEVWDGPFLVARFDLADPVLSHAVEIDGFLTHSTRDQQRRDRLRDRRTQKLGWTTSRFDAVDALNRLDSVIADVLAVRARLAQRFRPAG